MVCHDTPGVSPQSFSGNTHQDQEDQFISEPAGVWGSRPTQDYRAGEGFQGRQREGYHWNTSDVESKSALKANRTSLCLYRWEDRDSERNRARLKIESLDSISGLLVQTPLTCLLSAVTKLLVACLSPGYASCLNPCNSPYVQPNHDRSWT